MDREKFSIPGAHYLLSHSAGAQPKTYSARLKADFGEPWREKGGGAWDNWLGALDQFSAGLAPVIGADAVDICPQTNVSSALTKILFSLPERARRRKIVLTEDDFPTCGFVMRQAERLGYELLFLPGGGRLADIETWSPAFHDDVQLVLATHIFSNSSVMAPVDEISRRARTRGVFSILDIAQSAGAIPIRLNDWRPDFAVGTSLKYLCGGPGAAFLWAAPETADRCAPLDVGWFSHKRPFEYDIHDFEYADGAGRFTGGTPSIAPFAGACAGLEILRARSIDDIYAHNQNLISRLIAALSPDTFLSSTQQGARGSSALIKVRNPNDASSALTQDGIAHDIRRGAIRISVHLYNDEADIDALVSAIKDFL